MNTQNGFPAGLETIRNNFLDRLEETYPTLARFAIEALEAKDVAQSKSSLHEAEAILHRIAGTAGSLGFENLGDHARECEVAARAYQANTPDVDGAAPLAEVREIRAFLINCDGVLGR